MARVTLLIPDQKVFSTLMDIRIGDINYGGHMGNDRVLTIMHEARLRFLKALGYKNEINIGKDTGMIVADSVVVYRAEAFHGDQVRVSIALDDFSAYGMDIFYLLENIETDQEIARGKTGIVFFNYKTRKVSRIPKDFLDRKDKYTKP
jgi:acyl-CoA thioester hydrolase